MLRLASIVMLRPALVIPPPHHVARELRPSAPEDGDIRKDEIPIATLEALDHHLHQTMPLSGREQVIVDTERLGLGKPSRRLQQRGERPSTCDVHIHVDAAIVIHDEVLESIDALDRVAVVVVGGQEPAIVVFEELAGGGGVPDVDGEGWVVFDA